MIINLALNPHKLLLNTCFDTAKVSGVQSLVNILTDSTFPYLKLGVYEQNSREDNDK